MYYIISYRKAWQGMAKQGKGQHRGDNNCVRMSFGQKLIATMISVRWDESAGARHAKWQVTWTNQTVSRF